jgi:hypothetical protein
MISSLIVMLLGASFAVLIIILSLVGPGPTSSWSVLVRRQMAAHVVGACLAGQTRSHDRDGGGKLQLVVGQDVLRALA